MSYLYKGIIKSELSEIESIIGKIISDVRHKIKDESLLFDLRLILSELLINGYEHGNKKDSEKSLRLDFFLSKDFINMRITDEGKGFYKSKFNPKVMKSSGRGIHIVKSLSDKLTVKNNYVECQINLKYRRLH